MHLEQLPAVPAQPVLTVAAARLAAAEGAEHTPASIVLQQLTHLHSGTLSLLYLPTGQVAATTAVTPDAGLAAGLPSGTSCTSSSWSRSEPGICPNACVNSPRRMPNSMRQAGVRRS